MPSGRKNKIQTLQGNTRLFASNVKVIEPTTDITRRRQEHRKVYTSRKWLKIRRQVLKDEPGCRLCGAVDDLVVDHITPLSQLGDHPVNHPLAFDRSNLRTLCRSCNTKERNRLSGGSYQRKTSMASTLRNSLTWLDDDDDASE